MSRSLGWRRVRIVIVAGYWIGALLLAGRAYSDNYWYVYDSGPADAVAKAGQMATSAEAAHSHGLYGAGVVLLGAAFLFLLALAAYAVFRWVQRGFATTH